MTFLREIYARLLGISVELSQYNDFAMPITHSKTASRKKSGPAAGRAGLARTPAPAPAARSKAPARSGSRKNPAPPPGLFDNISPERKMDILGVVMALVGLLTLLSLFSAGNGGLADSWTKALRSVFGWGVYLLPVGLLVLGIWLVARNVDRLPELSLERIVGIILLFIGLLVAFHWLDGPAATAIARATQGSGGGYIGALLQQGLVAALGDAGTLILVIAWLVIALAMTLDLSMQEMFQWAGPLAGKITQRLAGLMPKKAAQTQLTGQQISGPPEPEGSPDAFTPIQHALGPAQGPAQPHGVTIKTNQSSAQVHIWTLPKVSDILEPPQAPVVNQEFVEKRARLIEETLASFGAPAIVVDTSIGPTVTMFGVEPRFVESRGGQMRVRVGKIAALADDLALALAVQRIRIQAPVPGRGYVGIEVPNDEMALVALREVVESEVFQRNKSPLRFALGKDVAGHPKATNLDTMPHLLIAGTTGSGKSVCVNAILSCLLLNITPVVLGLILVDP